MAATNQDLLIEQGKTFSTVVRWETTPIVYKAISAIPKTAPATLTVTAHGMPDGWRAAVVSVRGMLEINAKNTPPRASDFRPGTVTDVNTVQFNTLNASDFSTYSSGGYLVYNTPMPLTGYSARMSIKDKVGGTELLRLDSTLNNRIVLDATKCTITLTVDATTTAGLTWTNGVYDLELVSASGVVTGILQGNVTVSREVTSA